MRTFQSLCVAILLAMGLTGSALQAQDQEESFGFTFHNKLHELKYQKFSNEANPYAFTIDCQDCPEGSSAVKFRTSDLNIDQFSTAMKKQMRILHGEEIAKFNSNRGAAVAPADADGVPAIGVTIEKAENELLKFETELDEVAQEQFFKVYNYDIRLRFISEFEVDQDTAGEFIFQKSISIRPQNKHYTPNHYAKYLSNWELLIGEYENLLAATKNEAKDQKAAQSLFKDLYKVRITERTEKLEKEIQKAIDQKGTNKDKNEELFNEYRRDLKIGTTVNTSEAPTNYEMWLKVKLDKMIEEESRMNVAEKQRENNVVRFFLMNEAFQFKAQTAIAEMAILEDSLQFIPQGRKFFTNFQNATEILLANSDNDIQKLENLILRDISLFTTVLNSYQDQLESAGKLPGKAEISFYQFKEQQLDIEKIAISINGGQIRTIRVDGKTKGSDRTISFQNLFPIPLKWRGDIRNFHRYPLVHTIGAPRHSQSKKPLQLEILLSDLLQYDPLPNGGFNISPGDQHFTVNKNDLGKPYLLLQKKLNKYFKVKIFSDLIGAGANQPNGLIQTEGSVVFDINSQNWRRFTKERRHPYFVKDLEMHLGISKIENSGRFLDIRKAVADTQRVIYLDQSTDTPFLRNDSFAVDTTNAGMGYVNTFDLMRYADVNVGLKLNILSVDYPRYDMNFRADLGYDLFLTALRDSTVNILGFDSVFTARNGSIDTTVNELTNVQYNNFPVVSQAFSAGINFRLDPTDRIGVDLGARAILLKMSSSSPNLFQSYGSNTGNIVTNLDRKLANSEIMRLNTIREALPDNPDNPDVIRITDAIQKQKVLRQSQIMFRFTAELHVIPSRKVGDEFYLRTQMHTNFGADNSYLQFQAGYAIDIFRAGASRLSKLGQTN